MKDLSQEQPQILQELTDAYARYAEAVRLIEVPEDNNPVPQVRKSVERKQADETLDNFPATIE